MGDLKSAYEEMKKTRGSVRRRLPRVAGDAARTSLPRKSLPRDFGVWPWDARRAVYDVLKEINAWDREHGDGTYSPFNMDVAQRAVRQTWEGDE